MLTLFISLSEQYLFAYKNYKLLHYVTCATFPLSPPISMEYLSKKSVFGHT